MLSRSQIVIASILSFGVIIIFSLSNSNVEESLENLRFKFPHTRDSFSLEAWVNPSHSDITKKAGLHVVTLRDDKQTSLRLIIKDGKANCILTNTLGKTVTVEGNYDILEREWVLLYCHVNLEENSLETSVFGPRYDVKTVQL